MNQLAQASSAYLRQHADQPVHWQCWGPEALALAKAADKPVILSIGYATCHWCHVMARESFDDPIVAEYMNTHFVNIKVDREERPDLDQIYMEAAQVLSRSSGWPLNCFLTPDGRPFYAGTYFPPESDGRRQSWWEALQYALFNFKQNRAAVERQADRVFQALKNPAPVPEPQNTQTPSLQKYYDRQHGGFGEAPKFPDLLVLRHLLHAYYYQQDQEALDHVRFSVRKISRAGIYDLVGGGLARYAVDPAWTIPHFEKMLYDNALFIDLLADLHLVDPQSEWAVLLHQTIDFLKREMLTEQGAYGSALDADTEGEEGRFYRWTEAEIQSVLGPDAADFLNHYSLEEGVLQQNWQAAPLPEMLSRLFAYRQMRTPPALDPKIHLGWNALLASALLKAANSLGDEALQGEAIQLLELLTPDTPEALPHILGSEQPAFLTDFAWLIQAFLDVFEQIHLPEWVERADNLTQYVLQHFSSGDEVAFLTASDSQKDLPLNRPDWPDLETPSGNSTMAKNLLRLGYLLGRREYLQRAEQLIEAASPIAVQKPLAHPVWLNLLAQQEAGIDELAIIGADHKEFAQSIHTRFYPNKVLLALPDEDQRFPLSHHRPAQEKTLIYRCRDFACQRPVETPDALWEDIG